MQNRAHKGPIGTHSFPQRANRHPQRANRPQGPTGPFLESGALFQGPGALLEPFLGPMAPRGALGPPRPFVAAVDHALQCRSSGTVTFKNEHRQVSLLARVSTHVASVSRMSSSAPIDIENDGAWHR